MVYAYNHSSKFRANIDALGAVVVEVFDIFREAFNAIHDAFAALKKGEFGKAALSFSEALTKSMPITMIIGQGKRLANAYTEAFNSSLNKKMEQAAPDNEKTGEEIAKDILDGVQGVMSSADAQNLLRMPEGDKEGTKIKLVPVIESLKPIMDFETAVRKTAEGVLAMNGEIDKTKFKTAELRKPIRELAIEVDKFSTKAAQTFGELANQITQSFSLSKISYFFQEFGTQIARGVNNAAMAIQSIGATIDQYFAFREARMDMFYQKEKAAIESSRMSEEQKTAAMEKLDADYEKQRAKMARRRAIKAKVAAIFEGIINTATAVTRALAEGGPIAGPILAAIVGGLGAAQIGLIAAQPIPALAKGGLAFNPTMAMVGDNPGSRIDPEVIAPLSKLHEYMGDRNVHVTVSGRIEGRDILLVQEKALQDRTRTRGY
jgi:hypothetical protein